eukprot:scaffold1186_cov75-Skeletonema_marinoi.AAC.1
MREPDAGARPSRKPCPLLTQTRQVNNTRRGQAAKTIISSRAALLALQHKQCVLYSSKTIVQSARRKKRYLLHVRIELTTSGL